MDRHEREPEMKETFPAENAQEKRFESELKQAMARINAPASLAVFLENAAEAEEHRRRSGRAVARHGGILALGGNAFGGMRLWFGGAVAALVVLSAVSIESLHLRHRRDEARAVAAQQQFDEAQEITNRTLAHVRLQVERAGASLGQAE